MSEEDFYSRRFHEVSKAIRNWPKMPSRLALQYIGGNFTKDWQKGKLLQTELGIEVIPPKTECEIGAGYWDRITEGKWRDAD